MEFLLSATRVDSPRVARELRVVPASRGILLLLYLMHFPPPTQACPSLYRRRTTVWAECSYVRMRVRVLIWQDETRTSYSFFNPFTLRHQRTLVGDVDPPPPTFTDPYCTIFLPPLDRSARLIERQYRCLYPISPHSFDLPFLDRLKMDVSRLQTVGR